MALVVEDGTGIITADTWASLAEAKAYAKAMGNTAFAEADNDVLEPALRRGVRYLDAVYQARYAGNRTYGADVQRLSWPRKNIILDDGTPLDADFIPENLKLAQIEAAMLEYVTPGLLFPTGPVQVKQSVTVGPISVSYAEGSGGGTVAGKSPLFSTIDGLMYPLLDHNKTGSVAFLRRA